MYEIKILQNNKKYNLLKNLKTILVNIQNLIKSFFQRIINKIRYKDYLDKN